MADNVAFTPGVGATGATDDVGGVHYPRVKLTWGVDGTATDASATNPIPVAQTNGKTASVTLTRTADTTAYTANDVLGAATGSTAALTFSTVGSSGSNIMITGAEFLVEATAIISGESTYRLHLYDVTPPSALGDNAAFDLPSGDRNSYLGFIELGSVEDMGSSLYTSVENINKHVKLSGTDLFGYLVTQGGYTPTSARVYRIKLHTIEV